MKTVCRYHESKFVCRNKQAGRRVQHSDEAAAAVFPVLIHGECHYAAATRREPCGHGIIGIVVIEGP